MCFSGQQKGYYINKIQRLFSEFGYGRFQIKFESYRFVNACEMLKSIYVPVRCELDRLRYAYCT